VAWLNLINAIRWSGRGGCRGLAGAAFTARLTMRAPQLRILCLFPTVGAANPGSTIGALALKLADDLAREVGR